MIGVWVTLVFSYAQTSIIVQKADSYNNALVLKHSFKIYLRS